MYGAIRLGIKLFRGINWKAWIKISCTLAALEAQGIFYVWETEWNWKWFCACKFMVAPLIVISGNKKLKECICWYYSYTKYNNCQSFLSALWMPPAKGSEYDQSYSTMCGHLNVEFLLYIQSPLLHNKDGLFLEFIYFWGGMPSEYDLAVILTG